MQGWKHLLVGTGFLGFSAYQIVAGGSVWLIGVPLVASGFFFYRAFTGQTGTPGADFSLAVDFIRDPLDTFVDEAAARLDGNQDEAPRPKPQGGVLQQFARELVGRDDEAAEKPAFDPDVAIARYLANRPAGDRSPETASPRAAGFGRKGT